ncbi:TetR/AcrR family transcriptional regulator [Microbacterium rhizomatis]|uniref:TetR/AcrR family transcriptional regulator n=1 Tax=Microbacterium rhizomatis TaxID=1631477 RepID=A0A5J5IZG5_9MICO|nr:TetR/AcrR family transcriptional regulator [Microbacterium rhizomatis]KAA9107701.1 TetR/AcrR family transcriptional regulator [Microbacterium rhizomatis]
MDPVSAPRARRARGPYAKTAATRAAILDAALEVFAEAGYRGGSLRHIAERVGMSEPALMHHFHSKAGLLQGVLDHRDQRSYAIAPIDRLPGEQSIRGLIALVRHNASTPGVVELYAILAAEATSDSHPAHGYFVSRYEFVRASIVDSFRQLEEEGQLAAGVTPQSAADATIAIMDGLQVQWLLDRGALDMADELAAFLRIITRLEL